MSQTTTKKDNILGILAIAVIVGSYGLEKIVEAFVSPTKSVGILSAIAMTCLFAVVLMLISKCKSAFFGLLASIIGYKMMPVPITYLAKVSPDASILYYLLQRMAMVFFVLLIIKIYKSQDQIKEKIRLIPVIALIVCVPFFTETSYYIGRYFMVVMGNMLYLYFTQFAFYALAMLVIILVCIRTNYTTSRFVAYYEFVALGINILRKSCAVAVLSIQGEHVSGSLYCWIAIFAIFIVVFAVFKNIEKKKYLQASALNA